MMETEMLAKVSEELAKTMTRDVRIEGMRALDDNYWQVACYAVEQFRNDPAWYTASGKKHAVEYTFTPDAADGTPLQEITVKVWLDQLGQIRLKF